jgi:ATP-dependent DNA helicase RecG
MNEDQLKTKFHELMALPKETEWLEFKEARSGYDFEKLGKYFSALGNEANLKGKDYGWLVFGIEDETRRIVGTQYRPDRAELDKLKSAIANHTTSRATFVEIHELSLPEGRVVLFQIPAAPKGIPIAWKGHYYGREGESINALSTPEMEQIRNQAKATDWSAQICPGAIIDDLDSEAVLKARKEYKQKYPSKIDEVDKWDDLTFLNKAKVTRQGAITRTAIILLGKAESESFISPSVARITWVLKNENGVERDYEHFGPPFIMNAERVFAKIRNLKYRYLPDETLFPTEISQYDSWVIREALHNCIAHQDYELKGKINLIENPDELIFSNVGTFIPGDVETVIKQDSPPEIYRNPFLAHAMVNLNMIDTIGGGIKKMFRTQMERFFPLPDYDLTQPERVSARIQGKILNENYTRLLIKNRDIDLATVMLLDKVQKRVHVSKDEHRFLKSRRLIEGRYPNLFVSSRVAAATEEKAIYIRHRAFHDQHYKDMVIAFIREYGSASRKDIDELLLSHLSDALGEDQKKTKVANLLYAMSRRDNTISNAGSRRKPKWILGPSSYPKV